MANTEVIQIILETTSEFLVYMFPILGVLGGIVFIVSWIHSAVFGMGSRTFRG